MTNILDEAVNSLKDRPSYRKQFRDKGNMKSSVHSQQMDSFRVDIDFIKTFYNVSKNLKGNPNYTQGAVNIYGSYSQTDLIEFLAANNLPPQSPILLLSYSLPRCDIFDGACFEGNIDMQYLIGMASPMPTVFAAIPNSCSETEDPLLCWIIAVGNMTSPPEVILITFLALEKVDCN
jgi:hypothetical protein